MRFLLPDSIRGWVLLVILGGLSLSHLVAFSLFSKNRVDAIVTVGGLQVAGSVAAIVRLAEETSVEGRKHLIEAASSAGLKFFISSHPMAWEHGRSRLSLVVGNGLAQRLPPETLVVVAKGTGQGQPDFEVQDYPLRMRQDMMTVMHGAPLEQWVIGSVRLHDGSWLNFAAHPDIGEGWWRPDFAITLFWVSVLVVGLIVLAARFATNSFANFANAAERLGVDMTAQPMTEEGPREVRRAAQAFNEMQDRLRRFINGRTQMFAAISHDLRTPITRMRLRAEFVEDEKERSKMLSDLDEMEAMIASTLTFAREEAQSEPRVEFDLPGMLRELCADTEHATFEGPKSRPYRGQSMGLKRVFSNLIGNAVKYGGQARVTFVRKKEIRITIDDDGPGIPEVEMDKVFTPFYRVDHSRSRETGGSGLGLAVVRNIILAHGGEITLENRAEGGLRVTVILPTKANM